MRKFRKQGEALAEVAGSAVEDIFFHDREFLDFKISYRINDNIALYFSAKNLNNEPSRLFPGNIREHIGVPQVDLTGEVGYQVYGTTYAVGMTWRFGR